MYLWKKRTKTVRSLVGRRQIQETYCAKDVKGKGKQSKGAPLSGKGSKSYSNRDTNRQKSLAERIKCWFYGKAGHRQSECFKHIAAQNQDSPPSSNADSQNRNRQRNSQDVEIVKFRHCLILARSDTISKLGTSTALQMSTVYPCARSFLALCSLLDCGRDVRFISGG